MKAFQPCSDLHEHNIAQLTFIDGLLLVVDGIYNALY